MNKYVNMDARRLFEIAQDLENGSKSKADLLRIADNLQRMDEKLMNMSNNNMEILK